MAKKTWVYTNGSWKEVKNVWVYGSGQWRTNSIPFAYIGSWKPTIVYDFQHNPEWIASNLVVTDTSIQFSYKNNNNIDATIEIVAVNSNGMQALEVISVNINGGQTLIFNSDDYESYFFPNQTYTFSAFFKKTHYNNSNETVNNVTTSLEKTATPTTQSVTRGVSLVVFRITNNDNAGTATWQIRQNSTTGTIVQNGSQPIGDSGQSVSPTLTGVSSNTTFWLVNARVQSTGKTISDAGVNRSLTTDTTTTTTAPPLTFSNSDFGSINTDGGTSSIRTAVGSGTVYVSLSGSGSGTLQRRINSGTWLNTNNTNVFNINDGQTLQFRIINVSTEMIGSVALRRTNSSGVIIGTLSFNIPAPTPTTTTTPPPETTTTN